MHFQNACIVANEVNNRIDGAPELSEFIDDFLAENKED